MSLRRYRVVHNTSSGTHEILQRAYTVVLHALVKRLYIINKLLKNSEKNEIVLLTI